MGWKAATDHAAQPVNSGAKMMLENFFNNLFLLRKNRTELKDIMRDTDCFVKSIQNILDIESVTSNSMRINTVYTRCENRLAQRYKYANKDIVIACLLEMIAMNNESVKEKVGKIL